jgi:hypothetical protein
LFRRAGLLSVLVLPGSCFANLTTSVSAYDAFLPIICSASGTSNASCSSSVTGIWTGPGWGIYIGYPFGATGTASAKAAYGSLFASVAVSDSPIHIDPSGIAFASFDDTLTVQGGSGTGYISYLVDGSVKCATDSGFGCGFTVQQNGFPPAGENAAWGCFPFAEYCHSTPVPFEYQTPFYPFNFGAPFTLSVEALIQLIGNVGEGSAYGTIGFTLDRIIVLDQNNQPLPFSITSQSGTFYPGSVPEPSSLLLAFTLVVLNGGLLRVRWKSRKVIKKNQTLFATISA